MNSDTLAAQVAQEYGRFVTFAAAKASQKWAGYIKAKGASAYFDHDDIDQLALEGLLVLAGLIPARQVSICGKLAEVEAKGDQCIQHAIDLYVSSALHKLAAKPRTPERGSDVTAEPLEVLEDPMTRGQDSVAVETSPEALTGVGARWPLLHLRHDQGLGRSEIMDVWGLTKRQYEAIRERETEEFSEWAYANRRVAA